MEMPRRMSRQARDSLPFFRSDWMSFSQSEKSKPNGFVVGDEILHKTDLNEDSQISIQ